MHTENLLNDPMIPEMKVRSKDTVEGLHRTGLCVAIKLHTMDAAAITTASRPVSDLQMERGSTREDEHIFSAPCAVSVSATDHPSGLTGQLHTQLPSCSSSAGPSPAHPAIGTSSHQSCHTTALC